MQMDRTNSRERDAIGVGQVVEAYARWAPVYDMVFGPIMESSRKAGVAAIPPSARSVLEVGVGTGISLPYYPREMRVTGIDLSPDMLERARERVRRSGLSNIDGLHEMDASALRLPDGSFDVAMAMYVMTVVPDPAAVMSELRRVVKPGGRIIAISHFAPDSHFRRALAAPLRPLWHWLGWNHSVTARSLAALPGIRMLSDRAAGLGGFYRLVEFEVLD